MGLRSRPRWVKEEEEAEAWAPFRAMVREMLRTNLRLVVCGGRDFNDREFVWSVLDKIHRLRGISEIIEGGARGADALAGEWADAHRVLRTTERVTKEEWRLYGSAAGPLRNGRMLKLMPRAVIAFPGGSGTADCIRQARQRGIRVWEPAVERSQAAGD